MILTQLFRIIGVANQITYDPGITSTQTEKKRLIGVGLQVTGYAGNDVQGYHERAKIIDLPDTLIDVEVAAFTENEAKPGARIVYKEVGLDIPVGETFKTAIKCGATTKDLIGFYDYEIIAG